MPKCLLRSFKSSSTPLISDVSFVMLQMNHFTLLSSSYVRHTQKQTKQTYCVSCKDNQIHTSNLDACINDIARIKSIPRNS